MSLNHTFPEVLIVLTAWLVFSPLTLLSLPPCHTGNRLNHDNRSARRVTQDAPPHSTQHGTTLRQLVSMSSSSAPSFFSMGTWASPFRQRASASAKIKAMSRT
eukprot:7611053-Pyramimonas_sp.AAC.3